MKIIIFILVSVFSRDLFHEFKIGRYEIRSNEEDITLLIQLDRYDFLQAVYAQSGCNNPGKTDICMTEYITNHFKLNFDGVDARYEYRKHTFREEFIEMTFRIGINPNKVESIQVFNNMLIEQWDYQENVVYFMLHDKRRSFRLNKDRIKTTVVY